jgi:hypothetical protein
VQLEKSKRYVQKYKDGWEKDFPWLLKGGFSDKVLDGEGKVLRVVRKAKCDVCKFLFAESTDIRNLRDHANSKRHIECTRELESSDKVLDQFVVKTVDEAEAQQKKRQAEKVARAEIGLCAWAAAHNVAFNQMEHLVELLRIIAPDSAILRDIKLKRTKATYITVHGLGVEEFENLVARMKNSFYSIAIDEVTDVSVEKVLSVMVRILSAEKKDIEECLLTLTNPVSGTAVSITNSIDEFFVKAGIPWENCVGFGADTCNTMLGEAGGVKAELERRHGQMFVVGCVCHLLALCASSAAKVGTCVILIFFIQCWN